MKYAVFVLSLILVAAGIGSALYLYRSAGIPSPSTGAPMGVAAPFTQLASGVRSSITTRTNYLVTSDDQLRELWKIIGASAMPPTVDFTKSSVIAVFSGTEPTAGYSIAVTKVTDGTARTVSVTLTTPGITCLAAHTITAPFQVIEVPATTLPYAHKDVATTTGCLQ